MTTNRILVDTVRQLNPNLVLINSVAPHNRAAVPSQMGEIPRMPRPSYAGENDAEQPRAATLNSWKEIAAFLNRGVRTVQRWERELQLPVHRIGKGNRSPVFAFTAEIKFWLYANRARLAAEERAIESRPEEAMQSSAGSRMRASWARCQQLTEELTRLMQQHQLHTLRLAQNLETASFRWAEISRTRAPAD